MANRLDTGTASITINGDVINIKGEITWSTQRSEKETFRSSNGAVGGVKYTPKNPYVSMKVMEDGGVDTRIFDELTGVRVVVIERNEKQIVFPDCTQVGEVEVDAIEGEYTLMFESMSGFPEEIVVS